MCVCVACARVCACVRASSKDGDAAPSDRVFYVVAADVTAVAEHADVTAVTEQGVTEHADVIGVPGVTEHAQHADVIGDVIGVPGVTDVEGLGFGSVMDILNASPLLNTASESQALRDKPLLE